MYKRKYLIGIYAPEENGETLLALCESTKDFAEFMEVKLDTASEILRNIFNKKHHYVRFNDMCCGVEFIDMEEEDI